jgi:hypothetical protein
MTLDSRNATLIAEMADYALSRRARLDGFAGTASGLGFWEMDVRAGRDDVVGSVQGELRP